MKTHGKAEVVDHHLADLPLLLELVLRVQVVVPVRANAVDLVAGRGISFWIGKRRKSVSGEDCKCNRNSI